jgi:hypothetical protein
MHISDYNACESVTFLAVAVENGILSVHTWIAIKDLNQSQIRNSREKDNEKNCQA